MDPITIGLQVVGMGMQIFGGMSAADDAKREAELSKQISGFQQKQNEVRRQQMELSASRSQIENVRNMQRARAMATASAVNQGAQFGSGLQGGIAQINSAAGWQNLGIDQNLQLGNKMFDYQNQISGLQGQMADVKGQQAEDAAWASLGGSLMKSAGGIGNIAQTGWGAVKNFAIPSSNVGIGG